MKKLRGEKDHEEVYYYRKCRPCNSGNNYHRSRQEKKVRNPMPVQDNEDKRTPEPVVDAEEELRRKQAQAQEHQQDETNVQKSGKLLPFLNAKAEHHQSRIDSLDEKIANQTDKIDRNKAKIEALSARADKLEDTNRMLKAALGNIPLIRKVIENNEKRIQAIREVKIPKRERKIKKGWQKIDTLTAKRDRISHKLNRVIALNDTIRSFSIGLNKERREAFSDALSRLNGAGVDCLADKKAALVSQRTALMEQYNAPETNVVDKYELQGKINTLSERIQNLESKIMKLARPETHYQEQRGDQLDASMKLTSDKLGEIVQKGNVTMPDLSEETLTAAHQVETLDKEKTTQLSKVEEQLEDDANMIDGIINNGTKEDIDKAKAELSEGIRSMEELAENPFVSEEMREMAAENLANMKRQFSLLDEADDVFVESWLMDMLDKGQAELTEDGGFKVNADYYKELPRNERHYESMTEIQAVEVMSALTSAGIEFSAASRGEDKVSVTVSKKDVSALNDIMQESIGKAVQKSDKKSHTKSEHYQTINPDYYKSLPKEQRYTRVEPKDTAREIVKGLMSQNIPYSAVVRKNDTVAVTVSKESSQAFKQIGKSVKSKHDPELTDRTNGGKSAVTSTRKDGRRTYFSRSRMQKDVQRISCQGQQKPQQTPKKKDQELF